MFVKICGLKRPADAVAAIGAGANAIGLNFVPESRRRLDVTAARGIAQAAPAGALRVGVFRGQTVEEILKISAAADLTAIQVHDERRPEVIAALKETTETLILATTVDELRFHGIAGCPADIVMLDGPASGSGTTFEWDTVGDLVSDHKILLAGGLRPDNVADAIAAVRPWGVDVASGVENHIGDKDQRLIARFVSEARRPDRPRRRNGVLSK